jgi:hypothetical protein
MLHHSRSTAEGGKPEQLIEFPNDGNYRLYLHLTSHS